MRSGFRWLTKRIRRGMPGMPVMMLATIGVGSFTAVEDEGADEGYRVTADHWSLTPIDPAPPRTPDADGWARTTIDRYILDGLAEAGLTPGEPADRLTLIRRAYFNLHGLPPTPEDVARHTQDQGAHWYERMIDDLLASPRYGERWARHWLDVVRYAETNGFETNTPRPHAWRYRDYVIRAFNEDVPYDRFIAEQLAGDALGVDAATGFLVTGPYDVVKSPDVVLTKTQRSNELADMVGVTGTTFLGLTTGCARCHDHKFDPLSQKDFYALEAVFAGVQHGDRPMMTENVQSRLAQAEDLERQRAEVSLAIQSFEPQAGSERFIVIESKGENPRGEPYIDVLRDKAGHGDNPPGDGRGQAGDPGAPGRLPNISRGRYTWWQAGPGEDLMAWRLGEAGRFRLWLSWGSGYSTHARDAMYLIDTDGDPDMVDIPIPGNDDSMRSIEAIVRELCAAVTLGKQGRSAAREGEDEQQAERPPQPKRRSSRSQFRSSDAASPASAPESDQGDQAGAPVAASTERSND